MTRKENFLKYSPKQADMITFQMSVPVSQIKIFQMIFVKMKLATFVEKNFGTKNLIKRILS